MPPVVAAAGGAFTAFTAAVAASPLLAAAVQIGASIALSAAAQALAPRPKSQAQTVSVRAPVVPRDIVYGRVRKGGVLIFAHKTRNGSSDFLHLIYALAGHQIQEVEAIFFDGKLAYVVAPIFAWEGQILGPGVRPDFADSLVVDYRLGTDSQSAITNGNLPTSVWGPNHRCLGVPLLYLRLRGESDDYPNGIPNVTVLLYGKNDIFDPRTGTRGYTDNAALCLADYMSSTRYGLGLGYGTEGGIDTTTLIAAANVCDEIVARNGGGSEERYTCNGVLSSAATPKENIEALLTAMGGRAIYSADKWRIYPAAYTSPTVALTETDIRENGISVQTRRSIADNFNSVRGQFVSPENDWQPDDFPPVRSSVYLAEDQGIESWRDLVLPMTISSGAAQRLAKIELERTRRQQVVQVSGMLSAWKAQVGDTATLSYARWGWDAKPFEVRKVTLSIADGVLVPELTLAEASPLQYDWNATEEQIYAAAPQTELPNPFVVGAPGVPQVAENLYETRSGTVEIKATLTWPASSGPFLDYYEVQTRRTKDAAGANTGEAFTTLVRTSLLVAEQFAIATGTWEWRVRAVNTLGRTSAWATTSTVVQGFAVPPVALTSVTIQTNGNNAILKWALSTDVDVRIGGRIQIRHSASSSPSWSNSVSMDEVAGSSTTAAVPLKPGNYLLRAVDSSGISGPVVMVETKGATWVPFANVDQIDEHPSWTGTKTNVSIDGSSIKLTDVSSPGTYLFAGALDLLVEKAVRLRSVIDVSAITLASTIDDRDDPIDLWFDFDDTEGAEIDVIVEARTTDDDPGGTPTWGPWTRLDATETAFWGAEFRARLLSYSADYNPVVSALSVIVDEVV